MRNQGANLVLLQEVHCSKRTNVMWTSEFGKRIVFVNGDSNVRGVVILFCKEVHQVEEIQRDINGRYIALKLKIGEYNYGLINIYAPNTDDPEFFGM